MPLFQNDSSFYQPLIFLQNGWFITKTVKAANEKIIGLLRVRTDFGFENDIVKNGFEKDFKIPGNVGLSIDRNDSAYQVFNNSGAFLFSLTFPGIK